MIRLTKPEFKTFLQFLEDTFPESEFPTKSEQLQQWYNAVNDMTLEECKKMAYYYLTTKMTKGFLLGKMLFYKDKAKGECRRKAAALNTNTDKCSFCNNTGWINLKDKNIFRRCICIKGEELPGIYKQATKEELDMIAESKKRAIEEITKPQHDLEETVGDVLEVQAEEQEQEKEPQQLTIDDEYSGIEW